MLKEIYVKNFVLIDELHLEFDNGFSVFTGETGTGKSLLIDAISLLCGARASSEYVAQNKEFALVEGVFELSDCHPVIQLCQEMEIDVENEFIVTRKITKEGKSSIKINQRSISLSVLKNMMSRMLDIHSQHDTQYLLNKNSHRMLLDEFCNEKELLLQCKNSYQAYKKAKDELEECLHHELNNEDLDFLKYQIHEINSVNLDQKYYDEISEELRSLNQFEKLSRHLNDGYEYLNGNSKVLENLYRAIHEMEALNEFSWTEEIVSRLNDCYYELEELASSINSQLSSLHYDENRVNEINEYLFTVNNMKRKYGNSLDSIIQKKEELEHRIERIENREEVLDSLRKKADDAYKVFEQIALQLSEVRHENAKKLEIAIHNECADLYLDKARFEVRFEACDAYNYGLERVEFYISMNPGEPLKPLCNVASGGELSRLMLGLKTIFTDLTSLETVIFDEIDTGVSGKVALAIGKKMQEIAKHHQIFAITHLASVAACGRHHYVVEKHQNDFSTSTIVRKLTEEERIHSLAVIASNSESETALLAARELFESAQN